MNWEQMKNSPATRGFMTVAGVAGEVGGILLTGIFKPAFMSHVQNAENDLDTMVKCQLLRLFTPVVIVALSARSISEWNGQLNVANVVTTLGAAFLGAGLVDMAGLGLQAIGENRK